MTNRSTPLARLMIRAFRHFEDELLRRLQAEGIEDITYANLNVIRHLDRGGLRLSTLAKHAGISKQAMGKLIGEVERKGYVKLQPDPEDGRAKRVHYTRRGQELVDTAVAIVAQMEQVYVENLGKHRYSQLREMLLSAAHLFDTEESSNGP